jgi:hypothetical protein
VYNIGCCDIGACIIILPDVVLSWRNCWNAVFDFDDHEFHHEVLWEVDVVLKQRALSVNVRISLPSTGSQPLYPGSI